MATKYSWNNLPQELLSIIFKSPAINTQTLLQLNHVSKNWSQAASKVLYYQIDLNEQNIDRFLYTINELDSTYGEYVKIVKIAEDVDLTIGYGHDVIQVCKNLTQLWVGGLHDEYYPQLQYLYENEDRLQHYENGTVPSDFEHTPLLHDYNRAMVAMRENIVSLLLADTQFKTFRYDYTTEDFDYLAQHLDQFPRLKRLVIETHAPKYLYENDYLIQKCSPNLATVLIAAYNARMQPHPISRPLLDMHNVQQRPLVVNLVLYTDILTTKDMEYIMHAYPNIKHFRSQCPNLERSFRWEDFSENGEYAIEACVRFIDFAAHVPKLELFNLSFPPNVLEQALVSLAKHPQVKALSVSGGLFYGVEHASLHLISAEDSFLYGLTERSVTSWNTQLFFRMRDIKAPFENLLRIFAGNTIEHLTLNMDMFSLDFTQSTTGIRHMQTFGNSLSQVLDSFPNLKELYLKNTIIEYFSSQSTAPRHHLKTLSMEATGVDQMVLIQLSERIAKVDHFILHEIDMLDGSHQRDDTRWILLCFPETVFHTVEFLDTFASGSGCLVSFAFDTDKANRLNYMIKEDTMSKITQDQCDLLFMDTDMYRVDLTCASIKQFGVHSHQMEAQPLFIYFD